MRIPTVTFLGACAGLWGGCNLGVPSPAGTTSPSAHEQAAIESALDAARTIALLAHAIRPAGDLQAIFEEGMPFPACPQLDPSFDGNTIDLTLDFGAGCTVQNAAGPRIAGQLAGKYFAGTHSFEFTAAGLRSSEHSALAGSATGSFAFSGDIVLYMTIDVAGPAAPAFRGTARAAFGQTAGLIRITEASLTTAGPASTQALAFRNLVVDSRGAGNLLPSSGSATISSPQTSQDADLVIEFGEQTPIDGFVRVINSSAAQ